MGSKYKIGGLFIHPREITSEIRLDINRLQIKIKKLKGKRDVVSSTKRRIYSEELVQRKEDLYKDIKRYG